MEDCLFCKIATGEIPAEMIYQDENTLAFLDINPTNQGHVLVIPKAHSEDIFNMPRSSWTEVTNIVHKLSPIIQKATRADGINIGMNNGRAAGQIIFHPHVHIIPRYKKDGLQEWSRKEYKEGEAKQIAKKIRDIT